MAKLTKVYENGKIINTLTFKGKNYISIEGEWEDGVRKTDNSFSEMIKKNYETDDEYDDYELEEIIRIVDILDYEFMSEEIEEALVELECFE